jgi:tryptophan 2,3-dioxygenase
MGFILAPMSYGTDQILNGVGNSDYERYIRTVELLALQKGPDEWLHRDELLFTVVHQSSELWLKLASSEITQIIEYLQAGNIPLALRLLTRVAMCIQYTTNELDMLEQMSPWDYQQVRRALGHGSGFDSPGFNSIRKLMPQLADAFRSQVTKSNLSLLELFLKHQEHENLYQLAERILEVDERLILWRSRHFKVVERSIGVKVVGTQGTPVEVLGRLREQTFVPELWDIRTDLTNHALAEEAVLNGQA